MQQMSLMMACCRITGKRMGILGVSVRKTKTLTVTVISKAERIWHALCIKCVQLIVMFFIIHFIFMGLSDVWINAFSLGSNIFLGGHLRLESSCIQVNTVNFGTSNSVHQVSLVAAFFQQIPIMPVASAYLSALIDVKIGSGCKSTYDNACVYTVF